MIGRSPTEKLRGWIEGLSVLALVALAVFWALERSVAAALASATARSGEAIRTADEVWQAAHQGAWHYALGIAALLMGRWIGEARALRRRGSPSIGMALLVPAATVATGLGLALHWGYGDLLRDPLLGGSGYATGVLYGGVLAGLLLAVPWDPGRVATLGRHLLAVGALATLAVLWTFGETPGVSGARVRLFGVQPIEGVKLAFVLFLAASLGPRAEQLRYQRSRRGPLHLPRPRLLAGAVALLVALYLLLFLVKDLGPILVLSLVFLAFYYGVTRSWVELVVAGAVTVALAAWVVLSPPDFLPETVRTRLAMWHDPWLNGLPGGDQLVASLWAFSAGGLIGRGWGEAPIHALPTGHTDLVLAHLAEVSGLLGLAVYLVALLALVFQGLWIAFHNRTPERMLLALGLSVLLFAQLAVIFGGSTGLWPLTGIVVPLLSYGKTSQIAFLATLALLGRLAIEGHARVDRDELRQLRGGVVGVGTAIVLAWLVGFGFAVERTLTSPETNLRPVLAVGHDDRVFLRYDPRVRSIARRIRRGELLDRWGEPLVTTAVDGARVYPLGDALGTLLGPLEPGVQKPPWALEGLHDDHLRGLPTATDELGVWIEIRPERRDRILFTVPTFEFRDDDHERARDLQGPGTTLRFQRLATRDFRTLLPLVRLRGATREAAVRELADDLPSRSLQLTLDARLQQGAATALAEVVPDSGGLAAAVVVLDVDSGGVLARAQWPDFDPANTQVRPFLESADPEFTGTYGPWRDKTGLGGLFQTGSIFKVASALAWVREGLPTTGSACDRRGLRTFRCFERDRQGPFFDQPGWSRPIHDGHTQPDGTLELIEALAVSCNVFFAQVGLDLGPEPYRSLVADGLEIDAGRRFEPGVPGTRRLASTAFGQGAARMHPMEAARMIAAVGNGGIYRKCPPTLALDDPCQDRPLVDDPERVSPILAGLAQVVTAGTARGFGKIPGVRVFAKTGTATDAGRSDERPYGITPGEEAPNHSWFVALAEPEATPECQALAPGRLAVAVVVPRGGAGAGPALAVARRVIDQAAALGYFGLDAIGDLAARPSLPSGRSQASLAATEVAEPEGAPEG